MFTVFVLYHWVLSNLRNTLFYVRIGLLVTCIAHLSLSDDTQPRYKSVNTIKRFTFIWSIFLLQHWPLRSFFLRKHTHTHISPPLNSAFIFYMERIMHFLNGNGILNEGLVACYSSFFMFFFADTEVENLISTIKRFYSDTNGQRGIGNLIYLSNYRLRIIIGVY